MKQNFSSSVTLAPFQVLDSCVGLVAALWDGAGREHLRHHRKFPWMALGSLTWGMPAGGQEAPGSPKQGLCCVWGCRELWGQGGDLPVTLNTGRTEAWGQFQANQSPHERGGGQGHDGGQAGRVTCG